MTFSFHTGIGPIFRLFKILYVGINEFLCTRLSLGHTEYRLAKTFLNRFLLMKLLKLNTSLAVRKRILISRLNRFIVMIVQIIF